MINHNGKEYKKRMYTCITKSLSCTAEINTAFRKTTILKIIKKSLKDNSFCFFVLIIFIVTNPGGRHSNLLQYSCLEKPMDQGAWWATVHGVAKSQA